MSTSALIQQRLAILEPDSLEIFDESGKHVGHEGAKSGGGHFQLVIVARAFDGKPAQLRHRMVYEALGPLMKKEIHALAIKAYAPGEI